MVASSSGFQGGPLEFNDGAILLGLGLLHMDLPSVPHDLPVLPNCERHHLPFFSETHGELAPPSYRVR